MDDFEIPGRWWAPGTSPDEGPAGILRFRLGEGLRLKLIGVLRPQSVRTFGGMPSGRTEPRILGVTESGQRMTLIGSFVAAAGASIPGYEHEEYHAHTLYKGAHFSGEDEPRFTSAEVSLTHLTDWVGERGFRGERTFTPRGALARYEVSYEFPQDVTADTPIGRVAITHSFHQGGDHWSEIRLGQRAWFRVEGGAPLTLEETLTRFVSPLEMLVTLGTGRPNRIVQLNVYPEVSDIRTEANRDQPPSAVEVIFDEPGPRSTDRVRVPDMLFAFDAIRDRFPDAAARWLDFIDAYRRIVTPFFASYYDRNAYVDQRFLHLARSIEAYHRQRYGRTDLGVQDHEARVSAIVAGAPEEHREWLSERLEHSDEMTFRRRVRDLVRKHSAVMEPLIGSGGRARDTFVGRVYEARNQLTHLSEEGGMPEPPLGLFELNEALGTLLQTSFVAELGIPQERSLQLFGDYPQYQWAVRRVQARRQQENPGSARNG